MALAFAEPKLIEERVRPSLDDEERPAEQPDFRWWPDDEEGG